MSDDSVSGSITRMIAELKDGDRQGIALLWERYFEKLMRVARQKMGQYPRRVADEEDVAMSVMQCLCSGIDRGKFPKLKDRDDLWKLLVVITKHKTTDLLRKHFAQKQGGGKTRGDSIFLGDQLAPVPSFDHFLGNDPTPELLVEMEEEHQRLLSLLKDEPLRQIVQWKLDCFTNEEISTKLNVAISTVERKLKRIREIWLKALDEENRGLI